MKIIFERNTAYDALFGKSGTGFDCYHGQKLIGRFSVFKGQSLDREQEVYIEVAEEYRGKGYGRKIYEAFIEKAHKLGFKNPVFYAVMFNKNVASKSLCESLEFEKVPFWSKEASAFRFRADVPKKEPKKGKKSDERRKKSDERSKTA